MYIALGFFVSAVVLAAFVYFLCTSLFPTVVIAASCFAVFLLLGHHLKYVLCTLNRMFKEFFVADAEILLGLLLIWVIPSALPQPVKMYAYIVICLSSFLVPYFVTFEVEYFNFTDKSKRLIRKKRRRCCPYCGCAEYVQIVDTPDYTRSTGTNRRQQIENINCITFHSSGFPLEKTVACAHCGKLWIRKQSSKEKTGKRHDVGQPQQKRVWGQVSIFTKDL